MDQDYDSDSDVPDELKQDFVDEQTGDASLKRSDFIMNSFRLRSAGWNV